MNKYFVTGIGTEIGKTVVSAILTYALKADYWKPVQSGDLDHTDSDKIKAWAQHPQLRIHPETYRFKIPASPHWSAAQAGVEIDLKKFKLPKTERPLIVEGAGGILVPLNEKDNMGDLMKQLNLPVILVSRHYLGSINHTLLSINYLKTNNIPIKGIVFNGTDKAATEDIIQKMGNLPILGRIPLLEKVDATSIQAVASNFKL